MQTFAKPCGWGCLSSPVSHTAVSWPVAARHRSQHCVEAVRWPDDLTSFKKWSSNSAERGDGEAPCRAPHSHPSAMEHAAMASEGWQFLGVSLKTGARGS